MRFLLVTGIYPEAAEALRERMPKGAEKDYAGLYRLYSDASFGVSDRYAAHLAKTGWETAAVFGNDPFIQSRWADEHGVDKSGAAWWLDILCEQIRHLGTEMVFILDLHRFDRSAREEIRRRCPSVRWIVGWRSAPVGEREDFSDLDLFLSSLKSLVSKMGKTGLASERLGAGFDETLNDRLPPSRRNLPFTFCGSIGGKKGIHSRRCTLLGEVFGRTSLQIWSDSSSAIEESGRGLLSKLLGRTRLHGGVYGLDMYRVLGRSRLTLNVHIDIAGEEAVNMRLFEATGMAACLLTDNPGSVSEYFEVGSEVVGYSSLDDLVEKVDYLSSHPAAAREIAVRGKARTDRDHTLRGRSAELREILESRLLRS